ncbi:hypothetical protein C8R44DRAFT_863718 [Mycena epipterygia]|nr:hypothetical protein C8R44DRAFT_863718 [Mycena epipterygia]
MSDQGQLEASQRPHYLDDPALLNRVLAAAKPRSPTTNGATTPATRSGVLIYETFISFLKDACRTGIGGRSLSELARFQLTLDDYLVSMSSDNIVSGILGSLKCRRILLELSSEIGLDNDPNLPKALRTDRERIAALLVSIFDSQSAEDAVLRLEGDSAQCFLDAVLDILDGGFLITQEHSRKARRIIHKLSESCDEREEYGINSAPVVTPTILDTPPAAEHKTKEDGGCSEPLCVMTCEVSHDPEDDENVLTRERERERGRERRDEENELTRKISFLTATASEDWTLILDVCEHASASKSSSKEAVRALRREFKYGEPANQLAAARIRLPPQN